MFMIILYLYLLNAPIEANSLSKVIVLASKTFRPGFPYHFHIHSIHHSSTTPFNFSVSIANKQLLTSKSYHYIDAWAFLSIDIPRDVSGEVYIFRTSSPGKVPTHHVIRVDRKVHSILIQMDNSVYSPSQKVLFWIVLYDEKLKPCEEEVNITIYDARNNRIYEQHFQADSGGFITSEFQLAKITTFGIWKLKVQSKVVSNECSFHVKEFNLPLFQVHVSLPEVYVLHEKDPSKQQALSVTVTANYFYGRVVKGFLRIVFKYGLNHFTRSLQLPQGKAELFINQDELGLSTYNEVHSRVYVTATVEEVINGVLASSSASVPVCVTTFHLSFLPTTRNFFKPGLFHCSKLRLSKKDNSPLLQNLEDTPLSLDITLSQSSGLIASSVVEVSSEGDAEFCHLINHTITENILIKAKFDDKETLVNVTASKTICQFATNDEVNIQISLKSPRTPIKSNSELWFVLRSTEEISTFVFLITSRRRLIHSKVVNSTNSTRHEFSYFVDDVLTVAPEMRVMAYVVTDHGEVVVDDLKIDVKPILRNIVSIEVSKTESAPGGAIEVGVRASNDSIVGVYALHSPASNLHCGFSSDHIFREYKAKTSRECKSRCNSKHLIDQADLFINTDLFLAEKHESMLYKKESVDDLNSENTPSANGWLPESLQVQEGFQKGLIWTETRVGQTGTTTFHTRVPISPTSNPTVWLVHAFAISKDLGLGLSEEAVKVNVEFPFFISTNLPQTCVIGEEIPLEVNIYNHLEEILQVKVTLFGSASFRTKVCEEERGCLLAGVALTRVLNIRPKDLTTTTLRILPTSHGHLPIQLSVLSLEGRQDFQLSLIVKHEGIKHSYSLVSTIQSTNASDITSNTSIFPSLPPPELMLEGFALIEVIVYGNVLGPSIENLKNFHESSGLLGEKIVLRLASYAYILNSFNSCNNSKAFGDGVEYKKFQEEAVKSMNLVRQTLLTFMRTDGSFSEFGNNINLRGTVWLASETLKVLSHARIYIPIDYETIDLIVRWLIGHQVNNGSFTQATGIKTMEDSEWRITLTASVLISLITTRNVFSIEKLELHKSIRGASDFLEEEFRRHLKQPCVLSIVSYAFLLSDSDRLETALTHLESLSINEDESTYWQCLKSPTSSQAPGQHPPHHRAASSDILAASYALLTYISLENPTKATPILHWLLKQRSSNGDFATVQDSLIAIEALSRYESLICPHDLEDEETTIQIDLIADNLLFHRFKPITQEYSLTYQRIQVPSSTTELTFSNRGKGFVILQCNVAYYSLQFEAVNRVTQKLTSRLEGMTIILEIEISFKGDNVGVVAVTEVGLLSGYTVTNLHDVLLSDSTILHHHYNHDLVVFYFNQIGVKVKKLKLVLEQKFAVCNIKEAAVKTYIHHSPEAKAVAFYKQESATSVCPSIQ